MNNLKVPLTRRDYYPSVPYLLSRSNEDACDGEASEIRPGTSTGHQTSTIVEDSYTLVDLVVDMLSIAFFFLDVATDAYLIYVYYTLYKTTNFTNSFFLSSFVVTAVFVLCPLVILAAFGCYFHLTDYKFLSKYESRAIWICRFASSLLLLGTVWRYIEVIIHGVSSYRARSKLLRSYHYQRHVFEDADVAMLRLLEVFLESVPQIIIQLCLLVWFLDSNYVELTNSVICDALSLVTPTYINCVAATQAISSLVSLLSCVTAVVCYQVALRASLPHKSNLTKRSFAFLCVWLWQFGILCSRVISFAVFISEFPWYASLTLVMMLYLCMLLWLLLSHMSSEYCPALSASDIVFKMVFAFIYCFTYLNILHTPTLPRYMFYYTIQYISSVVITFIWYFMKATPSRPYDEPALILVISFFVFGMFFMAIYYLYLHPSLIKESSCVYKFPKSETCPKMSADEATPPLPSSIGCSSSSIRSSLRYIV